MILYLDTSALIPLIVDEPATVTCQRLWRDADHRVTSRLTYAEAAAAVNRAEQLGRLSRRSRQLAWRNLVLLWEDLDVIEMTDAICRKAVDLVSTHALRGNDSVQCASALVVADEDAVAASGDRQLLHAWTSLGVATCATVPSR